MNLLNSGDFADVFDCDDGTVVKVFRRVAATAGQVTDWTDHDFIIWFVSAVERVAYEKVHDVAALSPHIPKYFGPVSDETLGLEARFPTKYVTGTAFRIEKMPGRAMGLGEVADALLPSVEAVLDQIPGVVGRIKAGDCSCFIPGTRADFALIDFAYPDDAFALHNALTTTGRISEELRHRVSIFAGVA